MKHLSKFILILAAGMLLLNCSGTYKVKQDLSKTGAVKETPKWYVKYDRETMFKYQESGTAVSPDMELAVKKAVLLAKAKLIDRVNGEMNNQTVITKTEVGDNEDLTATSSSTDTVNNVIQSTVAEGYLVTKSEIFITRNKSYRAYVLIEMKKKNIEDIQAMKNNTIYYLVGLVMLLIFLIFFALGSTAQAGGPWSNQYCDIEVTKIKIIDQDGNIIQNLTEEKVVCQDVSKDFLHGMGIADSCQIYTWKMPLGGTLVEQRDIACQKLNGEYEIVPGYHGLNQFVVCSGKRK